MILVASCAPDPLRYQPEPAEPTVVVVGPGEQPAPCTAVCEPAATSMPVQDTFLYEPQPNSTYGNWEHVNYGAEPGLRSFAHVRALGEFPRGELLAARLEFTTINHSRRINASLLGGVAAWDESTTWSDMITATLPWAEQVAATTTVTVTGRSSIDIPLQWVEDWRSGAHLNNGVMLRTESPLYQDKFASAESADPPAFVVDYIECTCQVAK